MSEARAPRRCVVIHPRARPVAQRADASLELVLAKRAAVFRGHLRPGHLLREREHGVAGAIHYDARHLCDAEHCDGGCAALERARHRVDPEHREKHDGEGKGTSDEML